MLKITDVKAATVIGNYYWTYVRVYAGDQTGTGEGYTAPQLEGILRELSPLIIGEDALEIERICDKLRWALVPSGTSGIAYHAISAIEIALLDLVGKHLNVPVYTLLGGKFREKVKVYVDTHAGEALQARDRVLLPTVPKWMRELDKGTGRETSKEPMFGRATDERFTKEYTPEAYAKRARQMKDEGFSAIKFDLDVPTPYSSQYSRRAGALTNQEIRYLAQLVRAVREAVGEESEIMFDLHWSFNISSSSRLLKAVEPYEVTWIEDPLPPENMKLLKNLVESSPVPIATGENIYTRYGFARLLETGVPIVTPDSLKTGGLTETKFISKLAAMKEVVISPHNISSPLGTIAQAHLAASIPNFGVLEFHGHDVPIWYRLSKRELIKQGFIDIKDEPGLGIELDESIASKYALNGEFDL